MQRAKRALAGLARHTAQAGQPHDRLLTAAASVAGAAGDPPAPVRVRPLLLTLERSVGGSGAADEALLATGVFSAEVFPDLPIATTWSGLYKALLGQAPPRERLRVQAQAQAQAAHQAAHHPHAGVVSVETIGAQLRSPRELRARICAACARDVDGAPLEGAGLPPPAGALLLVSGSHPVRGLPMVASVLPANSRSLLRTATQLRQGGVLPPDTQLWAVANPVLEPDASLAEQKVAAGATTLLTQPPQLDWRAWERWYADADRRGLLSAARVVAGAPLLTSATNVGFWLSLCGAGLRHAPGRELIARFRAAEAHGKAAAAEHALAHNVDALQRLQALPGVAGLHVMPITRAAKALAMQLIESGDLAGPAAASQHGAAQAHGSL